MKKEKSMSSEHEKIGESKQTKNESIEAYLSRNYEFRFNTIKCRPEYKIKNSVNYFSPVNRFALNSFKRDLDKNLGINTSIENLRTILESDFSPQINPVKEYFKTLPRINPDEYNYTRKLAVTVEVSSPEKWYPYLVKWLVGVVANVLNETGCQNHLCLVLTGEQGKFKTTWLDHLCPTCLKSYLFTGKIDPQNKDTLTLIAEYLFINIDDQLRTLNKRDENELKNLITTPAVKYRRPYDIYIEEYPHLASFMASVNGTDFLTDPTGSRRFLPFEVLHIDIREAKAINMDCVFSEIMFLYEQGFRYWFDDEEIEELHKYSIQFHVQTSEYELVAQNFDKPPKEATEYFLTTSQIMNLLKTNSLSNLSEKKLGEALRKLGFTRKSVRVNGKPMYGWFVKRVDSTSVNY